MTKAIKDAITNTNDILLSDGALDTLMNFERVLDELDLYVFDHWKEGELVEGPVYEKYFVECTFMWPHKRMPDPRGGKRLLEYDCEVFYKKDRLTVPIKIKDPDDFKPGTKMPKMKKLPIWLVTIVMPKKLIQEIYQGSLELESATLDLDDLDQAYEEELDANFKNETGQDDDQAPFA